MLWVKAKRLTASTEVEASQDRGRVTWLVNQLADAPAKTVVEAWSKNARAPAAAATLAELRDDRSVCLDNKEAARFRVLLARYRGNRMRT